MATCDCLPSCPFFSRKTVTRLPKVTELMKQRLCLGNSSYCALYLVSQKCGWERVPEDLVPNQVERAKAILDAAG